jgi:hypothetical protein
VERPWDPRLQGPRGPCHAPAVNRQSHPDAHDTAPSDEASAAEARRRLREQGIVALEPDARIGVMLEPGERVVAVRREVTIERRKGVHDPDQGVRGDLYVTTSRLVCIGSLSMDFPIGDIREAVVAAGALLLVVGDGRGLEIRTSDPSLLRVEISAVREAARVNGSG